LTAATDLPRYAFLARCAQIFLRYLDAIDETTSWDTTLQACFKLFQKQSVVEYLRQVEENAPPPPTPPRFPNKTKTSRTLRLTNGNHSTGTTNVVHDAAASKYNKVTTTSSSREEFLALSFPVLVHIDVLLAHDSVEQAIDIAVRMERCSMLSQEDQRRAWAKIFQCLVQTGRVFLDGFPLHRPEYLSNRKIILEKIIPQTGPVGMNIFVDGYVTILEQVALIRDISDEEKTYIQRACHQTVLRILQAKYNEDRGLQEFCSAYWRRLQDNYPAIAGYRWSTFSVSSSSADQMKWATQLLCESNKVPVSLYYSNEDPTIDLDGLARREKIQAQPQLMLGHGQEKPTVRPSTVPKESRDTTGTVTLAVAEPVYASTQAQYSATALVDAPSVMESDKREYANANVENEWNDEKGAYNQHKLENQDEMSYDAEENLQEEKVEVVELAESSDDDVAAEAEQEEMEVAVPRESDDSDETADEDSVNDLFEYQDHHSEGESDADDHEENVAEAAQGDEEIQADTVDLTADSGDDSGHNEGATTAEPRGNSEEKGEEESYSSTEVEPVSNVLEVATSQSHDEVGSQAGSQMGTGYGSQTGYEPEAHDFTEEEVSEAVHTEDEDDERQRLLKIKQQAKSSNEMETAPSVEAANPVTVREPQTLSDMDAADEHTTEHEEDLGAESSELDEGDGTEAPVYVAPALAGTGASLEDFAIRAQQPVGQDRDHDEESSRVSEDNHETYASTPWVFKASYQQEGTENPVESADGDTGVAVNLGDSGLSYLDESSLAVSLEEDDSKMAATKVLIDKTPDSLLQREQVANEVVNQENDAAQHGKEVSAGVSRAGRTSKETSTHLLRQKHSPKKGIVNVPPATTLKFVPLSGFADPKPDPNQVIKPVPVPVPRKQQASATSGNAATTASSPTKPPTPPAKPTMKKISHAHLAGFAAPKPVPIPPPDIFSAKFVDMKLSGSQHKKSSVSHLAGENEKKAGVLTTPPHFARAESESNVSNSTIGVSSVHIPHQLASPGMSSVAPSIQDSPIRSPQRLRKGRTPSRKAKDAREEDLPKTTRKSNKKRTEENEDDQDLQAKIPRRLEIQGAPPSIRTTTSKDDEILSHAGSRSLASRRSTKGHGTIGSPRGSSQRSARATRGKTKMKSDEHFSDIEGSEDDKDSHARSKGSIDEDDGGSKSTSTRRTKKNEPAEDVNDKDEGSVEVTQSSKLSSWEGRRVRITTKDQYEGYTGTVTKRRGKGKYWYIDLDNTVGAASTIFKMTSGFEELDNAEEKDDANVKVVDRDAQKDDSLLTASETSRRPPKYPLETTPTKAAKKNESRNDSVAVTSKPSRRNKSNDKGTIPSKQKRATRKRKTKGESISEESKSSRRSTRGAAKGKNDEETLDGESTTNSFRSSRSGNVRTGTTGETDEPAIKTEFSLKAHKKRKTAAEKEEALEAIPEDAKIAEVEDEKPKGKRGRPKRAENPTGKGEEPRVASKVKAASRKRAAEDADDGSVADSKRKRGKKAIETGGDESFADSKSTRNTRRSRATKADDSAETEPADTRKRGTRKEKKDIEEKSTTSVSTRRSTRSTRSKK